MLQFFGIYLNLFYSQCMLDLGEYFLFLVALELVFV